MENKQNTIELLKKYNQTRLIKLMDKMTDEEITKIISQVSELDIASVVDTYNNAQRTFVVGNKKIEKISSFDLSKLSDEDFKNHKKVGEEFIKNGQYAVITMAGGQGTRLGHDGPKGTFKVSLNTGDKYLFQIIVEALQEAHKKYNVTIPWYIMTSEENNEQTYNFLENNNYFGYPKDSVTLFMQGKVPLISTDGDLILSENKLIKEASDGNGSIYNSLRRHNILEDMKAKNIKWVFVGGIDNILLRIVDPLLVGVTVHDGSEIASKSVKKISPDERVGVFCKIDGKPSIIEYSELPEDMANERDENGELMYGDVNILSHLFSIDALEELSNIKLPYHFALKTSDYLDDNLCVVHPTEKNVYKFESFIFDAFSKYSNMSILRVKREEEFAPIKNKTGKDSPETAIKLYNDRFKV